jgi:hypothetical protein
MDCVKEKYVYKGKDESYIIVRKIEQVVNLLSEKENSDFDTMYAHFLESNTYRHYRKQGLYCGMKTPSSLSMNITGRKKEYRNDPNRT